METPGQAAEDTLRQIAAALSDIGFAAKSGLRTVRPRGDLTDEIHGQADRNNRTGEVVRVRFGLMLRSAALARWRKATTDPAIHATGPAAGTVTSTQLAFAEGMNGRDFDVVNADDRPVVAETVAAKVRDTAAAWFEEMGDPLRALAAIGRPLNDGGPVNAKWIYAFALAHGFDAEARDALAMQCVRYTDFGVEFARQVALIRAEGHPDAYRDTTEELAAFAVAAGIAP